jgi:uncharacterized protein YeaO (DUF488 family)
VRKPDVRVRRVYEQPSPQDGTRVLVDRIWPRELTKSRAQLREWCKQVAPSTAPRKWYDDAHRSIDPGPQSLARLSVR